MLSLKAPSLLREQAYINGLWCDADDGRTFAVANPATGERIGVAAWAWQDSRQRFCASTSRKARSCEGRFKLH
jgi:acyl-CoA reductase-like NAD-dependent aldehyde dehydrogenase